MQLINIKKQKKAFVGPLGIAAFDSMGWDGKFPLFDGIWSKYHPCGMMITTIWEYQKYKCQHKVIQSKVDATRPGSNLPIASTQGYNSVKGFDRQPARRLDVILALTLSFSLIGIPSCYVNIWRTDLRFFVSRNKERKT